MSYYAPSQVEPSAPPPPSDYWDRIEDTSSMQRSPPIVVATAVTAAVRTHSDCHHLTDEEIHVIATPVVDVRTYPQGPIVSPSDAAQTTTEAVGRITERQGRGMSIDPTPGSRNCRKFCLAFSASFCVVLISQLIALHFWRIPPPVPPTSYYTPSPAPPQTIMEPLTPLPTDETVNLSMSMSNFSN
ncbi:hypothetical protein ACHAXA_007989 [Cyclostephanos tholiformis]|uniref:Transmembrane protein n=1 Tax=Cyclostephanos tholiformis TaxID=382380 RepID=A0ABD3R8Y4_9STRA